MAADYAGNIRGAIGIGATTGVQSPSLAYKYRFVSKQMENQKFFHAAFLGTDARCQDAFRRVYGDLDADPRNIWIEFAGPASEIFRWLRALKPLYSARQNIAIGYCSQDEEDLQKGWSEVPVTWNEIPLKGLMAQAFVRQEDIFENRPLYQAIAEQFTKDGVRWVSIRKGIVHSNSERTWLTPFRNQAKTQVPVEIQAIDTSDVIKQSIANLEKRIPCSVFLAVMPVILLN